MLLNLRTTADEEFHCVDGIEMLPMSTVKFRLGERSEDWEEEDSDADRPRPRSDVGLRRGGVPKAESNSRTNVV